MKINKLPGKGLVTALGLACAANASKEDLEMLLDCMVWAPSDGIWD